MTEPALHDWFIEQREYDRQESRRGRRHAYETLDPRRTALVVVDLVPFFFEEDTPYIFGIVPNVNRLAAAMRELGGLVAWVIPGLTAPSAVEEEFFGADVAAMFSESGGQGSLPGRLWKGLDTDEVRDLFVEKTAWSAFFPGRSPLPDELRARGIDTIVVTGTVTNVCVAASVCDASTLGFRVVVVADGCACRRDQDHNAALRTMYRTYGDVRPTDEVLALLRSSPPKV